MRAWLKGAAVLTQFADGGDLVLTGFSWAAQRGLGRILGGRSQIGDERRRVSKAFLELTAQAMCPHGCGQKMTWFHVQFECRGCCELVEHRRLWVAAGEKVQSWLNCDDRSVNIEGGTGCWRGVETG